MPRLAFVARVKSIRATLLAAHRETTEPATAAALMDAIEELDAFLVLLEDDGDTPTKPLTRPERFDFDAFLLDMFNPSRHMSVWE